MFDFFVTDKNGFNIKKKLNINPGYWGEKLQSICKYGGYRRFNEDTFIKAVTEYFNNYWEDENDKKEEKNECWEKIKEEVLSCAENEHDAYDRIFNFTHEGFDFQDFEADSEEYTFHYIWCLYAIVYGITEYNNSKKE